MTGSDIDELNVLSDEPAIMYCLSVYEDELSEIGERIEEFIRERDSYNLSYSQLAMDVLEYLYTYADEGEDE